MEDHCLLEKIFNLFQKNKWNLPRVANSNIESFMFFQGTFGGLQWQGQSHNSIFYTPVIFQLWNEKSCNWMLFDFAFFLFIFLNSSSARTIISRKLKFDLHWEVPLLLWKSILLWQRNSTNCSSEEQAVLCVQL